MLISHLLFADDTLFEESNLCSRRCILLLFEAMSGRRVNLSKSVLIPVGEVPQIFHLAHFFGCGVEYLPCSYLDLPLGAPYKCKALWEPIVERFHKRLAEWISKPLSKGVRMTLLQSTLSSRPVYFMSLFTIQATVTNQLEKIMRDFLWSSSDSNNGFHWAHWDDVCWPTHEGGLGIRHLCNMNKALKAKWLWRFGKEDDAMWRNVIEMKYGLDNSGWWCKRNSNPHGVDFWKSIMSDDNHFRSLVHYRAKNGSRILFWHGLWCGDQPLKFQFPNLFRMARLK